MHKASADSDWVRFLPTEIYHRKTESWHQTYRKATFVRNSGRGE